MSQEQRSNNKNKKYNFTIWTYHKVCELGVGKSFGDIALGKDISNRTATVIANEDAVLGSLHKDVYQISTSVGEGAICAMSIIRGK